MRYVKKPAPILLLNPLTKEPLGVAKTFATHVLDCWLSDARMGSSPRDLLRVQKLASSLESPDPYWEVEDQDYDKLVMVVEAPQNSYPSPLISMQLLAFSHAVLEAATEKPVELRNGHYAAHA